MDRMREPLSKRGLWKRPEEKKMKLEMGPKAFTVFRDYVGLLKALGDELTLRCDDSGISVLGMDSSHVAMIDSKVNAPFFEVYEAPEEGMITLNMLEFSKFLDRIEKNENVKITHDAEQAKLVIATRVGGRNRRFTLSVLEPLDEEVPKPKIFYKSEGRILTQSVDSAIKDADLVSEHIKIAFRSDVLQLQAHGDMGDAENEYENGCDELLELKSEEDSVANFTLSYLKDMFGQLKNLSEVVTLYLSTDMPLRIEVTPNDLNLEIDLYLAPMIGV